MGVNNLIVPNGSSKTIKNRQNDGKICQTDKWNDLEEYWRIKSC